MLDVGLAVPVVAPCAVTFARVVTNEPPKDTEVPFAVIALFVSIELAIEAAVILVALPILVTTLPVKLALVVTFVAVVAVVALPDVD